ncbi:MAG: hypothetical protein ABIR27_03115, partial [Dokdonella sp.]
MPAASAGSFFQPTVDTENVAKLIAPTSPLHAYGNQLFEDDPEPSLGRLVIGFSEQGNASHRRFAHDFPIDQQQF